MNASFVIDRLAHAAIRLGWPGLLGLGLLLAAAALEYFQVWPLERLTVAVEAQAHAHRPHPVVVRVPPTLMDTLPNAVAAPEGVARLFAAAAHAGLRLEQGSYCPAGSGGVSRYQIILPLSGDYPALRAFLAEALEQQPSLALDRLLLSRDSIASSKLKAKLSLTLYLREAP